MVTKIEPLCNAPDPNGELPPCEFLKGHTGPCSHALDRMVGDFLDRPHAVPVPDAQYYRPLKRPIPKASIEQ